MALAWKLIQAGDPSRRQVPTPLSGLVSSFQKLKDRVIHGILLVPLLWDQSVWIWMRVCARCCKATAAHQALLKQWATVGGLAPEGSNCPQCPAGLQMLTYLKVLRTERDKRFSLAPWQGPDVIWYLWGYFASFPAFHDEAESTIACPRSTTGQASVYPYWWFPISFFPTQDHRSMCHPHKHNQVTNTVQVWIIACPWLQEHGLQLLSVNTERSRKVFRWALRMKLHLLDHQKSWQIDSTWYLLAKFLVNTRSESTGVMLLAESQDSCCTFIFTSG